MRALIAACALLFPIAGFAQKVALTFDDLPLNGSLQTGVNEADIVRAVLPIFTARQAPPMYGFINAQKLEGNPNGAEALKLWVAGGQKVANHTYTHHDLSKISVEAFTREVIQNEPALLLLAKGDDWKWLRYPYLHEGETREKRNAVRTFLRERGYRIAQTTLDWEDYMWNSAYARCVQNGDTKSIAWLRKSYVETASGYLDANREMARRVFGRDINHVMLLHLGAFSPQILPELFALLKQKGFTLTTLEDAQSDPAYASDPQFVHTNTGTLLEQHLDKRGIAYPPLPRKPRQELDTICR